MDKSGIFLLRMCVNMLKMAQEREDLPPQYFKLLDDVEFYLAARDLEDIEFSALEEND